MFSLFKRSLEKVSQTLRQGFAQLTDKPTAQSLEELEASLLSADLGPAATQEIIHAVSAERQKGRAAQEIAKEILEERLTGIEKSFSLSSSLQTILIVGINGAGKTTTVAKLAHHFKSLSRRPIIGSADTFRAAANEQLKHWASRADVPIIESRTGGDPAAAAYDALQAALARGHDLLIVDTAGRLHTKEKLMEELGKIERVMKKLDPTAPQHRWLVLDGSLGLNSLSQAKAFAEALPLTGIIVTKLDGSAKGGFLVPLYETLKLPVLFVGLGEGMDDLKEFKLEDYLNGLLR